MKEQIRGVFKKLGFHLENDDEDGFFFEFEGHKFVYLDTSDDETFLNIGIPAILELEDEEDISNAHIYMDRLNASMKYVKCYIFSKGIWLFYEREYIGEEDLMEVIPRMIMRLDLASTFFDKIVAEVRNSDDDDDGDDDSDDIDDTDDIEIDDDDIDIDEASLFDSDDEPTSISSSDADDDDKE